ncbi:MAG: hypothetical protein ACTJH9_04895 [Pseudoalteromonas sp.]|uniref:hypothetical protein n=1 Tax=unclassified Pseudoalteromonas TaxID=194690 RepID=UPI003F9ABF54
MTLPIGSGFYSAGIPTNRVAKHNLSDALTNAPEKVTPNSASKEYVKSSQSGVELAKQLSLHSSKTYQNTIYDQPSARISKAISTYTEFANLERRADVQSLIGVDIYA